MSLQRDVSRFLDQVHTYLGIWEVIYEVRDKNEQTLYDLELIPVERTNVLKELKVEDYSEGPVKDDYYKNSELWVFGKTVKDHEVYIKITLAPYGQNVICISFHIAEHLMNYPLK